MSVSECLIHGQDTSYLQRVLNSLRGSVRNILVDNLNYSKYGLCLSDLCHFDGYRVLSRLEKPDRMFMSVKTKGIHHRWVFPTLIDPKTQNSTERSRLLGISVRFYYSGPPRTFPSSPQVGMSELQCQVVRLSHSRESVSLSFNSDVLLESDRNHVCEFL